jgi:hypothetical protein
MKRFSVVLVTAVVAVLAAAPKSTWADTLFSSFGPHSSLKISNVDTHARRMGFCLRPETLRSSGSQGSQVNGTPFSEVTNPTKQTNSSPLNNWGYNNQNQPGNVTGSEGGSTWLPQPNTTPVVFTTKCAPITATPEWGSTLLFLGVDLAGFAMLASLTGMLRRRQVVAA